MFEKPAHNALDSDVFRQARNARTQAADAAYDEHNRDAHLARPVQRIDHLAVDQRVHLRPDAARLAFLRGLHFLFDHLEQVPLEIDRRHAERLEIRRDIRRLAVRRHEIE